METVMFLGHECNIEINNYVSNDRSSISLFIKETGEPMCIASVNLPSLRLEPGEIAIKDYSENEGILDCLVSNNIVELVRYEDNWPIVKLKKNE